MHEVQAEIAQGFRLSFDHFGRSSSQRNHHLTQHFAGVLDANGLIEEVLERQVFSIDDNRFHVEEKAVFFVPRGTSR